MNKLDDNYTGLTKLRAFWPKVKANFGIVENAVNKCESDITAHKSTTPLDHPDGCVTDAKVGKRTVQDAVSASGTYTGKLTEVFDRLASAIRSGRTDLTAHKTSAPMDHPMGSATDDIIGPRTVNDPAVASGTASGLLTALYNKLVDAVRKHRSDVTAELAQKVDKDGAVTSVSGRVGDVVLSKGDVGLGNVDPTSDLDKPISTATQSALNNKVDKMDGKELSANDYTTADQSKLAGIAAGANNYVHPTGDGYQHLPTNGTENAGKVLTAGTVPGTVSWQEVQGGGGGEGGSNIYFAPESETPPMRVGDIWYIIRQGTAPMLFRNAGYENMTLSEEAPANGENWGKMINFVSGKLTVAEQPEADTTFYGDTTQ